MNHTSPATEALDDVLYAATEAAERIRKILALVHSDLTGSEYPEETEWPASAGIVDTAIRLRTRLEGIASALPEIRSVITSPRASQLNQAQNQQAAYGNFGVTGTGGAGVSIDAQNLRGY